MEHTVLFVDDDLQMVEGLRRALSKEPYRILCAGSAPEALDLLSGDSVDVVVADQRMPEMTGVDFLAQVRRHYPRIVRMMFTGYADVDAAVRAVNEGGVACLFTKPFEISELSMAIRHALRQLDLNRHALRLMRLIRRQCELVRQVEPLCGSADPPAGGVSPAVRSELVRNLRHLADQVEADLEICERIFLRRL